MLVSSWELLVCISCPLFFHSSPGNVVVGLVEGNSCVCSCCGCGAVGERSPVSLAPAPLYVLGGFGWLGGLCEIGCMLLALALVSASGPTYPGNLGSPCGIGPMPGGGCRLGGLGFGGTD